MRAIDTNVLARFIIRDDPAQALIADQAIAGGSFISATVMLEFSWLLKSRYGANREKVVLALRTILDSEDFVVADPEQIAWAVDRFAAGADFADMLHLVVCSRQEAFLTFDRDIARKAGPNAPLPVVTL